MDEISPRHEAEANQRATSDPAVSAFVAASAGSGKTRLLTDRLLRLMVGGAKPERILCLTFTKAAAAEMSLRLRRDLGRWVTMDGAALEQALRDLAIPPTAATLSRARSLFAQVLDLPGGMRIGTIHAFCQSLLRRFPLEAGLSPHFQLAEDRDAAEVMTEAREDLLAFVRPRGVTTDLSALEQSLRTVAGLSNMKQFGELVKKMNTSRMRWRQSGTSLQVQAAARRRVLGVTAADRAGVIAAAVDWRDATALRDAIRIVATSDTGRAKVCAGQMLDWLGLAAEDRARNWSIWRALFVTQKDEPRVNFVNKVLHTARPDLAPQFVMEAERILAVEDAARAADIAMISEALAVLATPLLQRYESRKDTSGLLEYDDLIAHSTALLADPGVAWVLYKLDGGLDHVLLDEVQDTAPEQWDIAHSLTHEFFAGAGARDQVRTVFAVGDRKQSIFSFQGADVAVFEDASHRLGLRVTQAGMTWLKKPLNVSFRSTAPVLALVDAVFADPIAKAGVVTEEALQHRADRIGHAGCVELWPLTEAPVPEPPTPWTAPDRNLGTISAIEKLADDLAGWIRNETSGDVMLESKGRALRPGDVMVLVRRRDALPAALVRSLKARGVPVAGLDRMMLTEQPAVQDLMTLGDSLLLPQDDLSFACLLTSPLGGLGDEDLMQLAIDRRRPLWEVLRDRHEESPAWTAAWRFFGTLLSRADYVTPHALLAEALGAAGGRERLLARLGSEAAEPIDELLNAALSFGKLHPPSLQGFLQWLRQSGAEITREAEAAGDQVRILTVHGAKGLQAPLVIMPDTSGLPREVDDLLWYRDEMTGAPLPIWVPRKEFQCNAVAALRDAAQQSRREEHNRLLYVALTRAEDRLLVCGTKPKRLDERCWYGAIARGFARLTDVPQGEIVRFGSPQVADPVQEPGGAVTTETVIPPAFLGRPPQPEPERPTPLAPSRPEGVEFGPVPASASPLARVEQGADRFRRGQLIHTLLQHLPALAEAEWHAAAVRFVQQNEPMPNGSAADGPAPVSSTGIAEEAMAILRHPTLAPLFGPGSRAEVPLTGVVGNVVVGGLIDRLVVLSDRVLLADFKTNRRPPAAVAATPVAYLRQMASYRAVLRAIFPGRPVQCALIWTRSAQVAILPDPLLDANEPGGLQGIDETGRNPDGHAP